MCIGDFDVGDVCVEFLYLWIRGARRVEGVPFNNESFGGFCEVLYHVMDVTLWDVL